VSGLVLLRSEKSWNFRAFCCRAAKKFGFRKKKKLKLPAFCAKAAQINCILFCHT
jgi:hypothetical protein